MLARSLSKFGNANLLNTSTTTGSSISSSSSDSSSPSGTINASDVIGLNSAITSVIEIQDLSTNAELLAETKTNCIKFTENELNFKNSSDENMLTITNENVDIAKPLLINGEHLDPTKLVEKDDIELKVSTQKVELSEIKTSKFVKKMRLVSLEQVETKQFIST